ncbi:nipped-B-like protein [Platysternon megacephalum]|uniref:Nipped-B-like protein n=1 Tax=Platysternon megacephalum TaxID=55544 RepID=A0A4D9ESK7_9SAUR|nr:nipped-B-like protein [Platysternon megacephalum]
MGPNQPPGAWTSQDRGAPSPQHRQPVASAGTHLATRLPQQLPPIGGEGLGSVELAAAVCREGEGLLWGVRGGTSSLCWAPQSLAKPQVGLSWPFLCLSFPGDLQMLRASLSAAGPPTTY